MRYVRSRWLIGGGLLLLAALAAVSVTPGRAEAHGVQVASEPPPNAQLPDPPETIAITFSEPIERSVSTIQVWDQSGRQIAIGALFFDEPQQMGVLMPEELPPGIYTVIWRNLSTIDGHIWSGSFPITILGEGGLEPEGDAFDAATVLGGGASNSPTTLESTARWVVLLGSAVMLGGVAYVLFVVLPAARSVAPATSATLRRLSRTILLVTGAIAAFLVLEGSLLQLIVQADKLGGLGRVDELLTDTRSGRILIARQGLLAIALLAMGLIWRVRDSRAEIPALGLLLAASFGVLLSQSLVSHAAASDGSFWTTSIDLLHLLAAAVWIGALIHIGLAMPRWLDELKGVPRTLFAAESFRRFSVLAAVSVLVLLASGLLSAFVQFTSWDELWDTSYGWSLIAKMAIMAPLLAMATLNAFILQPRVVDAAMHVAGGADDAAPAGAPEAVDRLQRLLSNTVRVEAVLGIAILVSVAVLIQLQAPRGAAEATEQASALVIPTPERDDRDYFQQALESNAFIISLKVEPAQLGQNRFQVFLGAEFGSFGQVLQDGVRLEFQHEDENVPGSRIQLPLAGSGVYALEGANLSLPGEWSVTANIRRRDVDDTRVTFKVTIADPNAAVEDDDGPPGEETLAESEAGSMWQWPFDGKRSYGAIATLAATGAIAAGWLTLRQVRRGG